GDTREYGRESRRVAKQCPAADGEYCTNDPRSHYSALRDEELQRHEAEGDKQGTRRVLAEQPIDQQRNGGPLCCAFEEILQRPCACGRDRRELVPDDGPAQVREHREDTVSNPKIRQRQRAGKAEYSSFLRAIERAGDPRGKGPANGDSKSRSDGVARDVEDAAVTRRIPELEDLDRSRQRCAEE